MDRYGIIGCPLGHSFSRKFFTEKFAVEGIDAEYVNFEIPSIERFPEVTDANPQLKGLNVTLPYKTSVIPYLHELSDEAAEIGAVNVIRVRNGRLKGFNSDIIGFTESIRPLLKPCHTHALILGTGGASRAVRVALSHLGIEWTYVSRTPHEGMFTYPDLTPEVMRKYTVVVNCSPVGMFPHTDECPGIPYGCLTSEHLLYDLVYNPCQTLFIRKGAGQGATVKNGLEMLHLQAVASWDFWNGNE